LAVASADVASGTPVAAIVRPACIPNGVCTVIKHVTQGLRRHWPTKRIVWRGDSHYAAARPWNGRRELS
jgi:hypothetical protein